MWPVSTLQLLIGYTISTFNSENVTDQRVQLTLFLVGCEHVACENKERR